MKNKYQIDMVRKRAGKKNDKFLNKENRKRFSICVAFHPKGSGVKRTSINVTRRLPVTKDRPPGPAQSFKIKVGKAGALSKVKQAGKMFKKTDGTAA